MLKPLLLAGLAAAAFIPSLASAQESCQQARHDNRVAGTIVGAGLGALLGNVVSGHGGKPGGTVIGGVGGAFVGNQIAGSGTRCGENQYGYYDGSGQWMPKTSTAYGYYGPDGRWVATQNTNAQYGNNQGYNQGYNQGANQQGYNSGYNQGYASPPAPAYGQDASYTDRNQGRMNFGEREARMDSYIRGAMNNGSLNYREGRRDLRSLANIRQAEASYRSNDGQLSDSQLADIDQRLDALRDRVHMGNDQRSY